jgi:hypothetical protein
MKYANPAVPGYRSHHVPGFQQLEISFKQVFFISSRANINYQLLIHAGHLKNPNVIVVSFFTFQDEDGLAIFSFDFMYLLRKTCPFVYGAIT